ncbi:aliphatic sulfonate ABC transporter substrate-binding protein [Burkholderia gladioli]|uniref:aliphatic sulfonate ABC transporter substrate-binding protein n=1 Tax=Burkholderia gladioli TaxID=28095 RepID=UPI00163E80DF|nr:aliphatic sulfonate ABC transporter substrate-binding protein [Burkholderia gladioli]
MSSWSMPSFAGRRRAVLRLLGRSLLALGVGAAVASYSSAALARDTVSIGYQRSSTLFILLKRNGELERRLGALGYDVRWHEFSSGLLEAMNSGSVDLNADVADAFALFTQAAHAPLTYYAEETSAPSAQAIVVPANSPIHGVADLRGKRVAVAKGSGCHYLLLAALKRAGLAPGDVDIRYLEASDALAAFRGGNVDAWVIWDPFLAAEQRDDHVRVIADGRDGLAEYNRFYTATDAFVERHPDALRAVFELLNQTGRWVKAHPDEAAKILAPVWGNLPEATVTLANGRRSYEIVPVRRDRLAEQQRIADTYRAAGMIPVAVKATDIRIWTPGPAGAASVSAAAVKAKAP